MTLTTYYWHGRRVGLIICVSLCMLTHMMAQTYPENAEEVYHSILRLEKEKVNDDLAKWDRYPVAQAHFANYMMFFELFIHEDRDMYERYYPRKEELLSQIQSEGDPSDPLYLYSQADIHLQWALVEGKFRDFFYALRDVRKAYALLEENQKRFPDFIPNRKNMGVMVALVGTIPEKYKWGFEWISGIPGDLQLGHRWLAEAAETQHIFQDEAIAMYGFMLIHVLDEEEKGWNKLKEISIPSQESPLVTFLLSNLALDLKKLEKAENLLQSLKHRKGQISLPQLNYYKGFLYLYQGKYELAIKYFDAFLFKFQGLHLIKSAWLYKAYCYYFLGKETAYLKCLEKCKEQGDDLFDEDAHALSVAEKGELLPVPILKVKVFFDGGNYEAARKLIDNSIQKFSEGLHQKILLYYQARIFHETGKNGEAVEYYEKVMKMPHPESAHYAANSALQIGDILKKEGNCSEAINYYQYCIELKAESYDNSLDQKAKSGLLQCR